MTSSDDRRPAYKTPSQRLHRYQISRRTKLKSWQRRAGILTKCLFAATLASWLKGWQGWSVDWSFSTTIKRTAMTFDIIICILLWIHCITFVIGWGFIKLLRILYLTSLKIENKMLCSQPAVWRYFPTIDSWHNISDGDLGANGTISNLKRVLWMQE